MSQGGVDDLIEAQGEAKATLHENAAGARQSSGLNTKLIAVAIVLLAGVVVFAATPSKTERQQAYDLYQQAKQHEKNGDGTAASLTVQEIFKLAWIQTEMSDNWRERRIKNSTAKGYKIVPATIKRLSAEQFENDKIRN
jgi:biopolymer transport protein ExbD